jgi:hypothetical protein
VIRRPSLLLPQLSPPKLDRKLAPLSAAGQATSEGLVDSPVALSRTYRSAAGVGRPIAVLNSGFSTLCLSSYFSPPVVAVVLGPRHTSRRNWIGYVRDPGTRKGSCIAYWNRRCSPSPRFVELDLPDFASRGQGRRYGRYVRWRNEQRECWRLDSRREEPGSAHRHTCLLFRHHHVPVDMVARPLKLAQDSGRCPASVGGGHT